MAQVTEEVVPEVAFSFLCQYYDGDSFAMASKNLLPGKKLTPAYLCTQQLLGKHSDN